VPLQQFGALDRRASERLDSRCGIRDGKTATQARETPESLRVLLLAIAKRILEDRIEAISKDLGVESLEGAMLIAAHDVLTVKNTASAIQLV
jgi:hypothetical protein